MGQQTKNWAIMAGIGLGVVLVAILILKYTIC